MSKVYELIQRLCPDGVEYKALGEVCAVLRGKRLTKKQLSDSGFPVFHGGLEPIGCYSQHNRTANTVMIINVGASAGTVGFSSVDFWSSDGCYCLEHPSDLLPRFLYQVLCSSEFVLKSKVRHAGIPTLDSKEIERVSIPVPPIEVQQEIVRILDAYTALEQKMEANLQREIAARKKQYEHYRDELLTFPRKES